MQVLLLVEEQAAAFQVADDVAIAVLDPAALVVGGLGGERAVGGDGVDELRALAFDKPGLLGQQDIEVNFAEGRGLVDDAGARIDGDEVGRHDPPGDRLPAAGLELAFGFVAKRLVVIVERRHVAQPDEVCAAKLRLDLRLLADLLGDRLHQRRGHDQLSAARRQSGRRSIPGPA